MSLLQVPKLNITDAKLVRDVVLRLGEQGATIEGVIRDDTSGEPDFEPDHSLSLFLKSMRVFNRANLSPETVGEITTEISAQESLSDVMAWALSSSPGTFIPSVVAEVVVQDEFTHDVIVPWRDGLVLVYDTT